MKVFKGIMWTLSTISILIISVFLWCYFFVSRPLTSGVTFVSSLKATTEDAPLEDAVTFITINALTNKNDNGKNLYEIQLNSYMGTAEAYKKENAKIHSYGYQLYDINYSDLSGELTPDLPYTEENTDYFGFMPVKANYYYAFNFTSDIYSYELSYLNNKCESVAVPYKFNEDAFIVSVKDGDNQIPLMLKYRGDYAGSANYINSEKYLWFSWDNYYKINSTFFIYNMLYSIQSLEQGTHYITMDLSDYFECSLYNEKTKQFDIKTADTEFTWVTIKANISNDGIKTHNQSMFGMVACNDGSVTFDADSVSKYWKVLNNIYLSLDGFSKRKSSVSDGYYLYLDSDFIEELNNYKNNRVHITLDISPEDKILGFDNFAFYNLELYSCVIYSEVEQDFLIMPNCFDKSNFDISNISGLNTNIIDLGGIYE